MCEFGHDLLKNEFVSYSFHSLGIKKFMEPVSTPAFLLRLNEYCISIRKIGNGSRRILFFHGFPGSSAQIDLFGQCLKKFDLEVICVDRPGYSQSSILSGNQFEQAKHAIDLVLDHYHWDNFELVSVSGGTPFLFHFAQQTKRRFSRVTVVSGLAPISTIDFNHFLSKRLKFALSVFQLVPGKWFKRALPIEVNGQFRRSKVMQAFMRTSKADNLAMSDPFTRQILANSMIEAFQQNGLGPKKDVQSFLFPWALKLSAFDGQIDIWHGGEDLILPPAMAAQMAAVLPRAKLHIIPKEGHYSLAVNKIEKILEVN